MKLEVHYHQRQQSLSQEQSHKTKTTCHLSLLLVRDPASTGCSEHVCTYTRTPYYIHCTLIKLHTKTHAAARGDINQHCFHTQERMRTGVHSTTEKKKKKHFEARQINRTVPLRGKSFRSLQYFPYFSLPTCNQTAYCKKFKDGRNETQAATIHKHARSTVLLCLHCSPYSHLLITVLIRWL